jgi:hypothetical protein
MAVSMAGSGWFGTQSICTAESGETDLYIAPKTAMKMAATLTVSWNCRNFDTPSYTFRPHLPHDALWRCNGG